MAPLADMTWTYYGPARNKTVLCLYGAGVRHSPTRNIIGHLLADMSWVPLQSGGQGTSGGR